MSRFIASDEEHKLAYHVQDSNHDHANWDQEYHALMIVTTVFMLIYIY
jgi:hypothetical protein